MPIDYEFEGVVSILDPDTCEYKTLGSATCLPDLESDFTGYADDDLERLKDEIIVLDRSICELNGTIDCTAGTYVELRSLILQWMFSEALQSGDRRKIKRAKRKYKAAKRELKRRILNDS